MPKQFPIEFRQRALRLLAEARQQQQYETEWAAIQATASRLGVNSETLRKWLRRSEVDAGRGRVSLLKSRRRSAG